VAIVNARPVDGKAPSDVEARLRAALLEAIGTRDVVAAFALRSALSAIGNAGAVRADSTQVPHATSPHVAGAVAGPGAAEVPRRHLTTADISEIVRAEAAERASAAGQCAHAGHPDRAERLRREAGILLALLDEME
jgi:ABC-type taurine transport system substrate-binding protein